MPQRRLGRRAADRPVGNGAERLCTQRGDYGCPTGTFAVPDESPGSVCRYGPSDSDVCVPTLLGPGGRGAAARYVLGGWHVNGIVQAQTGFPLTVIEPNNISLTSLTNRPNMTCDPNEGGARTVAQWFNTACFQRLTLPANAGQIGDEPRNAVRGAGFNRTDLSLVKNFAVAASHQVQLRIEAFNIFNSIRFGQPTGTLGSPTFGAITMAEDGRIVQLGIKYSF